MGAAVDGQLVRAAEANGRTEVREVVIWREVVQGWPKKKPRRAGQERGISTRGGCFVSFHSLPDFYHFPPDLSRKTYPYPS